MVNEAFFLTFVIKQNYFSITTVATVVMLCVSLIGCNQPAAENQAVTSPTTTSAESESSNTTDTLEGTSWQLVQFQGSDDTTLTPDNPTKYKVTFAADNQLIATIDCNQGQGSWTSSEPNQLELSELALTRAICPPGSLHDRIVQDWTAVRSYVIQDNHLFLSLMADGGIYEFEPMSEQ